MTNAVSGESEIGTRKIAILRGAIDGSVSSQWCNRPDDQRFIDLESLADFLRERREKSYVEDVNIADIRAIASESDPDTLGVRMPDGHILTPNNYAFTQLCTRLKAPSAFLRERVAASTAANVLNDRILKQSDERFSLLAMRRDGDVEFRAITSLNYGRIWDHQIAEAALDRLWADGTWKVPGVINWRTGEYDPDAAVDKRSTTLYASDRDVFVFLVRDKYPISVGTLSDGSPDYIFPGIIISNSEVGSRSLSIATMYLRGVCMNRNLWGVQDKRILRFYHKQGLPHRFFTEVMPAINDFSQTSASAVARKVIEAKRIPVGETKDEVLHFVRNNVPGSSKKFSEAVYQEVLETEHRPPTSLWDIVQGISSMARRIPHQDQRVALEIKAGDLMEEVMI